MSAWWIAAWLHLAVTLMMAGIIWSVQLVQYPLMAEVGRREFTAYHRQHMRRIGWVVMPLMLVEAGAAVALAVLRPAPLSVAGMVLLAAVWTSTFSIQVPLHARLQRGRDPHAIRRLVSTNWLRTWLWSGRAVISMMLVLTSG